MSQLEDDDIEADSDDEMTVDGAPGSAGGQTFYFLPDSMSPLGILARCSLKYGQPPSVHSGKPMTNLDPGAKTEFGIASDYFFRPG